MGVMEESQECCNRAIGQLDDMFDCKITGTEDGIDFGLANTGGKEGKYSPPRSRLSNPPQSPTVI